MKALAQLMAASASVLAIVSIPSCSATCEEQGTCGTYKPPTGGTSGTSGTGGNTGGTDTGGTSGAGSGGGGTGGSGGTEPTGGTGGAAGADGTGGMGGMGGMGPDPCDPENPTAGCAVTDPDGIFVAPSGSDTASGSKDEPFATIGRAITQAATAGGTIYVCNATFAEHLVVSDDGLVIRGGYTCPSASVTGWLYEADTHARVAPTDPGYALHLQTIEGFTASDVDFASPNATAAGGSSVAVFAVSSTAVSFERTRITAGNGVNGDNGVLVGSNHFGGNLNGSGSTGLAGGGAKECACNDGSKSIGAAGGLGGLTPTAGGIGLPDYGMGGGSAGTAGTAVTSCMNGGLGASAPTRIDASGASIGSIDAMDGWRPGAGASGSNGQPGQGGGGGGGAVGSAIGNGSGGGGGGACGGCGGNGGPGGKGGGGSIGLLALDSEVTFDALSFITTGDAGAGGSGVAGQGGQDGGTRGAGNENGCLGGAGGRGAAGGAGGGGAGGVSVGILFKGGMITTDGVMFTLGSEGAAGQGAGANNDGANGVAEETLELP